MKTARLISGVAVSLLVFAALLQGRAMAASPANLVFREIKITGDEFVVLQNVGPADITHLSDYWLGYASGDSATAPPAQQLPDFALPADAAILFTSGATTDTCDASIISDLSPSLSDTAGSLSIWLQSSGSFTLLTDPRASARWAKSTTTHTLPAGEIDLKKETNQYNNPVWFYESSTGFWALASLDSCVLTTYASPADISGTEAVSWPQNSASPPAHIISLAASSPSNGIPPGDFGLKPPQITELLPNPAPPVSDSEGEFVELYNSNSSIFDLGGFILQTGTTNTHKYTFPAHTVLKPQSFTAFSLKGTGLSLTNSGSQVELFDPTGRSISKTDNYPAAKDGQSWALADGRWYWTTTPTPSAENMINEPRAAGASGSGSTQPQVLGSSTQNSVSGTGAPFGGNSTAQPLHPSVLAGVGALAVGYALYEYRQDLANNLRKLRRYNEARAAAGPKAGRRRSSGAAQRSRRGQDYLRERVGEWIESIRRRL